MIPSVQGLPPILVGSTDALKLTLGEESQASPTGLSRQDIVDEPKKSEQKNDATQAEKSAFPSKPNFSAISKQLEKLLQNNTIVQFTIDDETKKVILKIINADTKEVIRQLPPEESLKIAQFITNKLEHGKVTDAKI